ncbi:MAG TPA: deoxyribonuclease IV [Streptosporangiaceae bacterium]|nr:deoxyribonuclease IV [Streptosporangiaceae bacterium]
MVRVGAHDREGDPVAVAGATEADVIQFFLGDPQGWGAPTFPGGDAAALRAEFAKAGVDVYIHSPYGINVASANNRIRIPSRKLLDQQLQAAAAVGAKALIVHGGHVTAGVDEQVGYENWRKAAERIERPVPLLIENTAGGDHAMARGLDGLARLWEAIGDLSDGDNSGTGAGQIGLCLDTCHAYASGEDLAGIVDRVKSVTGRLDLVHCNNSRDEFGSGRDRHAGIESGTIDPALLLDVIRAADAPVVCETPDPATDIRWLRDHLS